MQEAKTKKEKKGEVAPLEKLGLDDILSAIDDIVMPDELSVISSRALLVKRKREEDLIGVGDMVVMSPITSPTMHKICGPAPRQVSDKTRDGMLVIEVAGTMGKFSRDKLLLFKKAGT